MTGDEVYTINGWERVITPTETEGIQLVNLKTRYSTNPILSCTPEHEILCLSANKHKGRINGKWNKERTFSLFPELQELESSSPIYQKYYNYCKDISPEWKIAQNFTKQDYTLQKIETKVSDIQYVTWTNEVQRKYGYGLPEKIEINNDFCELVGIWLAEGSCNGQSICFTINQNEEHLRNRILQLMWNVFRLDNFQINNRKDSQAQNISFASKQLVSFFSQLFEVDSITKVNQWNKYVPVKLLYISPEIQLQLFKGWFLGDGYARTARNGERQSAEAKGTTVSKQLADDINFILKRNYINPTIIVERRKDKKVSYNVQLYSKKADRLYDLKYLFIGYQNVFNFKVEDRGEMDFPVYYKEGIYLKAKVEEVSRENINEKVYCLVTPSHSFTINNIIVHNCRGYRSEEYTDGIEIETALFLSGLIPMERGFLWSIHDVVYGNEEKDRKPNETFIKEVSKYPGLLKIIQSIEGLTCKRGQHASGVILYNNSPYDTNALMRSPNGDLTTQFDLHMSQQCGDVKYDFLVTEICDKITICIDMLQKEGFFEPDLGLRQVYDRYLHPAVLNLEDSRMWDALGNGTVMDVFQFSTGVGLATAKQIKPRDPVQLTSANALMRLMGEKGKERPMDRYCRLKNDMQLWHKEVRSRGLSEEEIKILEPYYLPNFGTPCSQEDLMEVCMDKNIAHFTLAEANMARKIVA